MKTMATDVGICLIGLLVVAVAGAGPDVIISNIPNVQRFASSNGYDAISLATTVCNTGDVPANWITDTTTNGNQHPVIAQNYYRLSTGRFEQIGMSWLKHGFCAVNDPGCGTCQPTNCQSLGVHCADTYIAYQNAIQAGLGPRSQVNAATGYFPYPFTAPMQAGVLARRARVHVDDLNIALHPGALFFAEAHYVLPDDAAAGNDDNNLSFRRFEVVDSGDGGWDTNVVDSTQPEVPALYAWQAYTPAVTISIVDVPDDGRFVVGSLATALGDGTWQYEYAVFNMNSDRSLGGFSIPLAPDASVSSIGFHDVDYHSGEPYDGTDWEATSLPCAIQWSTHTHAENPLANALRWSTLYNFRFRTDAPPSFLRAEMRLFKPGTPASMPVLIQGPAPSCWAGDSDCDGDRDLVDFQLLQRCASQAGPALPPDCVRFDVNCDALLDAVDVASFETALSGP